MTESKKKLEKQITLAISLVFRAFSSIAIALLDNIYGALVYCK